MPKAKYGLIEEKPSLAVTMDDGSSVYTYKDEADERYRTKQELLLQGILEELMKVRQQLEMVTDTPGFEYEFEDETV